MRLRVELEFTTELSLADVHEALIKPVGEAERQGLTMMMTRVVPAPAEFANVVRFKPRRP